MLSQLKLSSLYIVAAIALAAWLAFSIILATQGAKGSLVSTDLKPESLNLVEWFGKPPALITTPTPALENIAQIQAPAFTLFGTSLFGHSHLALIGPLSQEGGTAGATTAKWVEEGEVVEGKYRIKSVTNRTVVIGLEGGKDEWTLNLPVSASGTSSVNGTTPSPGSYPPAKDFIELPVEPAMPSALNNRGFNSNSFKGLAAASPSSKKCQGVIKVPKMAIDVLNQQQAMLARGLESQPGGGLRVRPELAALVGGLGFMAGDILSMSDTIPLTSAAELLNIVISPLSQGREIKIQGKRGSQQRQWRLVNEIMC
ncbi:MAG: hypothetical protein V4525_09865 [Pseudomonadota bacterium]